MTNRRVRVGVLGPLRVWRDDGTEVTPAGSLQRRLLALLVLRRGDGVSADMLVEALWGDDPPRDPAAALQTHVFRLRQALPDGAIESLPTGYRLDPEVVDVDADRLAAAVATALALGATNPAAALAALEEAGVGRPTGPGGPGGQGPAFPELVDTDDGRVEASRLDDLRLEGAEARLQALLDLGRATEVVGDATAVAQQAPLRERPRALLMTALAATGRRVEALRVYDDFRRLLGDELGIEPSPSLRAQHTALLAGDDAGPEPSVGGPASLQADLPVPPTTLVGREALVADTVALVDDRRLLTLLGTGGVGKTRVVLEVGRRLQQAWPDRPVVLCELAGATAGTALETVATALGVELRAAPDDPRDHVAAALRVGETVLLLDNCEHVLEPIAELVERVLARTGGVRILTTSRERLRVAGEQVVPVPPLPVPPPPHLHGPRDRDGRRVPGRGAVLGAAGPAAPGQPHERDSDGGSDGRVGPAVELFVARARAVRPDFRPDPDDLDRVADVVRRLDGLPLAIELAAARLQTLSIDEVAAGLDRRFHLLTTGVRTTTRHRSLAAAVSWSYGLLDPPLQRLFADLSVFAGPFMATDATAVHLGARSDDDRAGARDDPGDRAGTEDRAGAENRGDGDDQAGARRHPDDRRDGEDRVGAEDQGDGDAGEIAGEIDMVAALAELAERSLVSRASGGRYALLETMRAFGAEDLERAGRRDETAGRHAAHQVRWAERADQRLRQPGSEPVLGEVDARLPDLRAAFGWLVDHGDVDGAGRLVMALYHYGFLRVRPEVHLWAERVWALDPDGEHPLMPSLWGAGGEGAWEAGDAAECGRRARQGLALVEDGREPPYEVAMAMANHALSEGRLDEARRWFGRGGDGAGGDVLKETMTAACVVLCLAYAGDPSAREQARELLAAIEDQRNAVTAFAWYAAGEAELDGDAAVALRRYERALTLAEATGCSFVVGVAGSSAASIEARIGDPHVAAGRYRTLLHHWRRAGMWPTQWTMLRSIAGLLARLHRPRDAAVLLGAVTTTDEGHRVYGSDAALLAELDATLEKTLGEAEHREACAQGARLDGEAAVEHALRALGE